MSPIRTNIYFVYIFVTQHQPLQMAGNKLLMFVFLFFKDITILLAIELLF